MYLKLVVVLFFQLFSINNCNFVPKIRTLRPRIINPRFLPVIPPLQQPTKCLQAGYDSWITYGNNICYYVSGLYQGSTWHDANDFCRLKNASLLSIHDINTNNLFARRRLPSNAVNNDMIINHFTYYWIGMNSMSNRGIYKWSDGTPTQFTRFTRVRPGGNPLNPDIYLQGRCVAMNSIATTSPFIVNELPGVANSGSPGYWYKVDCDSNYGFFCSKNFNTPTTIQPTTPPPGNCPPDWIQYANQKCIKIITNTLMTWTQAKGKCAAMSGELLAIHSQEEQDFVTSLIANKPMPYIGLTMNDTLSRWVWDDQSLFSYSNWAAQDPTIFYRGQACAVMTTTELQSGKWLRVLCNSTHTAICERQKDPNIAAPSPPAFPKCTIAGSENVAFQYRNSCYSLFDDPNGLLDFNTAETKCQSMNGAHLVSIVNPFEYSFLKYYITQNGKEDQYWIGFYATRVSDNNVSQLFKWTDNWPSYFTQWDDNEPLFAGEADQECVFQLKQNGTWRTGNCTANKGYICKKSINPLPQMNSVVNGICPKINATNKKLLWLDLDKRSQYCYWFSVDNNMYGTGQVSWADASFQCRKRNGTLASIHNNHDLSLLRNKITNSRANTWIGLNKQPNGDFSWEDGSAIDFTNWEDNQIMVIKQSPTNDDSGEKCVSARNFDLKWRSTGCTGYAQRNFFVCQTKKVSSSASLAGLSGGAKAGIVIGVLIGITIIVGVGIFVAKRFNLSVATPHSFDNSLHSSRRDQSSGPKGSDFNNVSNDLTKTENDNHFQKT